MLNLATGGTFTRASEGSYQPTPNTVAWAASDERRFDNQDGDGAFLLLEGPATNQLLYSEDFSNAAWTKTNTTPTNGNSAPDGDVNDAYLLTGSGAGAKVAQTCAAPTSGLASFSVWLKKGATSQNVTLRITDGTTAVTSVVAPTTAWVRYDVRHTGLAAAPTCSIEYGGASDEVYAWGAQCESTGYPTSYVRTTSAAATRARDVLFVAPANGYPWGDSRKWGFVVRPLFTNNPAEYVAGTIYTFVGNTNIQNMVGWQNSLWFILQGGFTRASCSPGTFSRHAQIRCEVDLRLPYIQVSGEVASSPATGSPGGGPYTWGQVAALRLGGRQDLGGVEIQGRYEALYYYA